MSNTAVISAKNLSKFYGKHRGISDVNLDIDKGEIFGLLGPNGAGKTTCIRILLDFIRATSGSATILGMDSRSKSVEIRRNVGYLPGDFITYEKLTAEELLQYFANLRGGHLEKAKVLAERFDLDLSRKIGELSRGNRQKVGIIQAFMSDPKLLILDEPTTGLDPLLQQEFHALVLEEAESGKTLFISSHVLPEVEIVCDRVGIIRAGSIIAVEEVATLRKQTLTKIAIEFGEVVSKADFESVTGVREVTIKGQHLSCSVTGSLDSLIKLAAEYTVVNIQAGHPALEEVFLNFYNQQDTTTE